LTTVNDSAKTESAPSERLENYYLLRQVAALQRIWSLKSGFLPHSGGENYEVPKYQIELPNGSKFSVGETVDKSPTLKELFP